jgi:hypothetical protein
VCRSAGVPGRLDESDPVAFTAGAGVPQRGDPANS